MLEKMKPCPGCGVWLTAALVDDVASDSHEESCPRARSPRRPRPGMTGGLLSGNAFVPSGGSLGLPERDREPRPRRIWPTPSPEGTPVFSRRITEEAALFRLLSPLGTSESA